MSAVSVGNVVANSLNNVELSGILTEVVSLLPIVIPTIIGFLAVRKGISFLIGSLRRA